MMAEQERERRIGELRQLEEVRGIVVVVMMIA